MRLVTWNVNSLRMRFPRVLEFLEEFEPDVACLQETKVTPEAFPEDELRQAGYSAVHHSGGRWCGVAILARAPLTLEDPVVGLAGEEVEDEARWCEATVGDLRVASTYVTNGQAVGSAPFAQKLRFLAAMADRAEHLSTGPRVIAGDFNVAPADIDVYDVNAFIGSTHVTDEERGLLSEIQARGELADAFRVLHPDEQQFTWWDYRQGHFHRGLGMRLDLALVSRDLVPRLKSVGMVRNYRKGTKPSDHAPLLVELD